MTFDSSLVIIFNLSLVLSGFHIRKLFLAGLRGNFAYIWLKFKVAPVTIELRPDWDVLASRNGCRMSAMSRHQRFYMFSREHRAPLFGSTAALESTLSVTQSNLIEPARPS